MVVWEVESKQTVTDGTGPGRLSNSKPFRVAYAYMACQIIHIPYVRASSFCDLPDGR